MPKDYTDQQIAERIAERRAKTQELKKKHRRNMILQVVLSVLALALITVLIVFAVHALSGRSKKASESDIITEMPNQIVEESPSSQPPAHMDVGGSDSQSAPIPEEPEESDSTAAPAEPAPSFGAYSDTVIYVDPGRGFSDLGCTSEFMNGITESEVNLAVARKVEGILTDYGFSAILTHDTNEIPASEGEDYVLDQLARVSMANTGGCDLYLSLHCDVYPDNPKASGTRLYYCTDVENSGTFADSLAAAVSEQMAFAPRIAGYETENAFIVTSQIAAPSVLVELGFVTDQFDAQQLLDEDWRTQIARALANGVIAYFEANLKEE